MTTKEASIQYEVDPSHIRRLIVNGILEGVRLGHDWLVLKSSAKAYFSNPPRRGPKTQK